MRRLLWHWGISALALLLATLALPHTASIAHWYDYLWLAPLLGLVNVVVAALARILSWFAFPVNLLTLGCFGFLLSFVLYVVAIRELGSGTLLPSFIVPSFLDAAKLAVVMALFSCILNMLLPGIAARRR